MPPSCLPDVEMTPSAAALAAELVRGLFTIARKRPSEPLPFALDALVEETMRLTRPIFGEDTRREVALDAGGALVVVDRALFEQILVNLLLNARDAMPSGGRVRISTSSIRVEPVEAAHAGVAPGNYARIQVADEGIGMTEEVRVRAFEPFFTTKSVGQGTGLGLATCHGIVKQAGGHISLQSAVAEGTTVTVLLPRVTEAEALSATAGETPPSGASALPGASGTGRDGSLP